MPEIRLALEAPDSTPERLDRATRALHDNLRRVRGLSVHRPREEPPPDGRGGGALLAELVLGGALTTSSVAAVSAVLTGWVDFGRNRAITLRCDDVLHRIEADAAEAELEAVLGRLHDENGG
ncbi:hypothetical protein ABZ805_07810 [Saccharopolyspora sp. NPDC047091]|uniref:hypothetical protein n=1 Tax=Saccharopolyspora sp. NPDC047091 TaxID=3155924 RepID=UPI003411399E